MEQSRLHIKKLLIIVFFVFVLFFIFSYFLLNKSVKNDKHVTVNNNCVLESLNINKQDKNILIRLNDEDLLIDSVPNFVNVFQKVDCNLYVIRQFNFDYKKYKALDGFATDIWLYSLSKGTYLNLINLSYKKDGITNIIYQYKFYVSNSEKYISLVQGYLGSDDYALHIKDIETKENVIEVNLTSDLFKKYPNVSGDVEFRGWTEDEKYFWFSLFDQANVLAYVRVNMENSNFEVFEAPVGTMNQDAFNINTGWVTYDDGPPWSGIQEFDQEYQEEWDTENKKVNFYLFNIFTKEQILLDSQSDVTFWHYPKWLDDKTLEYTIPGGEIKKYTLN